MGTQERREREKQETRKKILDAARELFASEGYDAVTMRRIADKIEYSPTAIYFHFKDKEALIHELCVNDFRELAHAFAHMAQEPNPIERLRQAGIGYVRFAIDHPNHYRLMFMTPHPPLDPCDVALLKGNPEEDAYAFLKATVSQAIDEGRLRPELTDPELVAQMAWASVHGLVSLRIAKAHDDWIDWRPLEKSAQLMIDAFIRGVTREGK